MSAPFGVEARCERKSISSGKSTLWASIRVDPKGKGLESDRSPLAVALVLDVSGSMQGVPLAQVIAASEIVSTVRSLMRRQQAAADSLLAQKMDSLETIAGGLAHEILNPLNYLKNALLAVQKDSQSLVEVVRNTRSDMIPYSAAPAACRRRRPFSAGSTVSFTGSSTVTFTFGNHLRRT